MIALRRAPGAQRKVPQPPHEAKIKTPRIRRHRLRAALTRPERAPLAPAALRKRELMVVTALAACAVLAVTGIAAAISYSHMQDWARANHEPDWRARLFPLSVDGAILASTLVLYADSRAGRRADKLAYFITLAGIAWSVGANIGHTWVSDYAAKMIAGWPPIAMALSVELLFRFARRWRVQADADVRKAARRADRPTPAAKADVVDVTLAAEPEPVQHLPLPRPESGSPPAWMPEGANARSAALGYLAAHPGADAPALREAVGRFFSMDASYARRIVRQHGQRIDQAAGQEG